MISELTQTVELDRELLRSSDIENINATPKFKKGDSVFFIGPGNVLIVGNVKTTEVDKLHLDLGNALVIVESRLCDHY